jgi:CMP-N,N'-diacetyllegionaminic acid synthase
MPRKNKILGIIPARGNSKGVAQKNIRVVGGKPLIAYTIEAALKSQLDRIIVSTEDKNIAAISIQCNAEVMIRSKELSKDNTPTLPVLQDVINRLNEEYDAVMTLQPTSPLRTHNHINETIDIFNSNPKADSLVSVVEIPHNFNPYSLMQVKNNFLVNYIQQKELVLRRQDKKIFYGRNGAAIYITRMSRLNEYIFGGRILPYIMHINDSLDIDNEEDLIYFEFLLSQ